MSKRHVVCLGGTPRRTLIAVMVVAPLVMGFGFASPVLAKVPTGDFAVFKQCPRFTAGVEVCFYAQITSGEMMLDKLSVPFVNTVTLQGGLTNFGSDEEKFVGALDGETLSATPQVVPGGLSSLIDCDAIKGRGLLGRVRRRACRAVFESSRFQTVNATTELARPANEIAINTPNEEAREGTALSLPVRVHLENPLLGKGCYIGSSADPIVFNLTTGTTSPPEPNKPISGKVGVLSAKDEFNFIEITEHSQVDNAFSAPGATGCGGAFSFLIDPLIDSRLGLPSPAGYNTVIHNGTTDVGTAEGAIASEQEEPNEKHHQHKEGQDNAPHHWWH
jgi:hypothetical protein